GQLRIVLAAEDRAGPGVRVDEAEVLRGQTEPAPAVAEVLDPSREEGELRGLRAAQGEQGELVAAVHAGEDRLPVLEIVERDEPPTRKMPEQLLSERVGCNSRRNDQSRSAFGTTELIARFGEQGCKVDSSDPGMYEPTASMDEILYPVHPCFLRTKCRVQSGVLLFQTTLNECLALGEV